jgi:anti-anti-sigma factor
MTEFVIDIVDGIVVIKLLLERATLSKAGVFKKILTDLIEKGHRKIIIDCHNVEFMDSTFLGAIIVSLKRIKAVEGDMRLVFASKESPICLMLETTRMLSVLKSCFSVEEAIQKLKND